MLANNGELSVLNTKTICYDPTELRKIHSNLMDQHDYRYKIIPIEAIKIIRSLRLNRKRRRHQYTAQKRLRKKPTKTDRSNLILLNERLHKKYTDITIATCNVQSIRNKDLQLSDLLDDYSIDILAVTETWLADNQADLQWSQMTPLNRDPYKISTHNRQGHKGGGIALITKSDFAIKLRSSGIKPTFEYATWEVSIKNKILTVTTIYHPPYSLINKSTNGMFLDEFTDYMANLLPDSTNNIVMGDFNLHVSKEDDVNSAIFTDTIEAMGLYQHVSFPTHRSGNTLDLIISELQNSTAVKTIIQGPFISDHCAIISTLNIKKLPTKRTHMEVRKTNKITAEEWMSEFDPDKVALNCNLDEAVANLGTELRRTLDKLAPLKRCSISIRPKKPWFNKEMAPNKAKVRRREKRQLKYRLLSCWTAFKNTRNSYYGRLKRKRKQSECK